MDTFFISVWMLLHSTHALEKLYIPDLTQQKSENNSSIKSYSIRLGQDVNLTCVIQVPSKDNVSLFKLDWRISKDWGPRFTAFPLENVPNSDSQWLTHSRTLAIKEVNNDDAKREYVCTYERHDFLKSRSMQIILLEKEEVHLSPTTPQTVPGTIGQNVSWIVHVGASFNKSHILWHKTIDGCVVAVSLYPERYIIMADKSNVRFTIKSVTYEDYGDHRVTFFSKDNQISTLELTVKEVEYFTYPGSAFQSKISFTINSLEIEKRRFLTGEDAHFVCKVARWSNNLSVSWYFSPCDKFNTCLTANNQRLKTKTAHSTELEMVANTSGRLQCLVSDGFVTRVAACHVCVTNIETELELTGPSEAFDGDNVLFTCVASDCEPISTGNLSWYYKANDSVLPQPVFANVVNINGPSWKKSTLRLVDVTRTHSGVYICEHNLVKYVLRESLRLSVYAGNTVWPAYVVPVVAFFIIIAFLLWYILNHREKHINDYEFTRIFGLPEESDRLSEDLGQEHPLHETIDILRVDPKWEFPRAHLHLGRQIGFGFFGSVYEAQAMGIKEGEARTTVAVKTGKRNAQDDVNRALIKEFKIMSHIGRHEFVVRLLGASVSRKVFFIIFEFCKHGSLHSYLLNNRERFMYKDEPVYQPDVLPLDMNVLIGWSYQIARGMDWLSSRRVLHGDLAARNILLTDGNIIKVADFGLSSDLYRNPEYKKRTSVRLPVKWSAIESIRDRVFSTQSDVWSFGVVLWELFSLAATPYPEFQSFSELWEHLKSGYRMKKPDICPDFMYKYMRKCWEEEPRMRPSFTELADAFYPFLTVLMKQQYSLLGQHREEASSDYCSMYNLAGGSSLPLYVNVPLVKPKPQPQYLTMNSYVPVFE